MKRFLLLAIAGITALSMVACSSEGAAPEAGDDKETLLISTLNGDAEKIDLEVPYNPDRIAVMDLGALDIIDQLDLGGKITGVSKGSSIDYLEKYISDDSILNLGTVKEADLETLMEADPELIFIGGRLSPYYDELIKIAPVVYLSTDQAVGVVASTEKNAMTIASIFGKEDQVESLMAEYAERIQALEAYSEGKNAVIGMVNAGGFNLLGNDGRCSIIGREIGFDNIGLEAIAQAKAEKDKATETTSAHGNEASFEVLVSINPEYIFVMDRDAAIATEGALMAREVMDNELVHMTEAYKNDQIVFLDHSNVWYLAEGGITALGIMLDDLENSLL